MKSESLHRSDVPATPSLRPALTLIVIAILLMICSTALADTHSAKLTGKVFTLAPSGERVYLSGTTISLECPADAANNRSTQSDATGTFHFSDLATGDCAVTATSTGFQPLTESAQLQEGHETVVELQLTLEQATQSVDVSAEAPTIDVSQTTPQTEIQSTALKHAPLSNEQVADAIPLVPGAVRGPDGLLNIKGAHANQSGMVVNSANATDPVTGEQGFRLPIDVVESVQVIASPYSAEYGKVAGAVTKIQTLEGTEKLKFSVQNIFPRTRKRDGDIRGIEAATPRVTLSGPIKKSKAYFTQSLEYRYVRTRVPGLKHLDGQLESDTGLESFSSYSQVDWETSPNHHLSASLSIFPQKIWYATLNTFNPQEATPNSHTRGYLGALSHRWILPSQSFIESELSIDEQDGDTAPATSGSLYVLAPGQNSGSYFNRQSRDSRRFQWQSILNMHPLQRGGEHLFKIGYDVTHIGFDGFSTNHTVEVRDSNGVVRERVQFQGPGRLSKAGTEFSFFVQDTWTPISGITIAPGLRIDNDTLGEKWNPAPRVGFSAALTKDHKTLLRGGVGRFYDKIPLNVRAFNQFQGRTVTRFASDGSALGAPTLLNNAPANDYDNPRSWAWNAELDREVWKGLLLRLSYQQRQSSHEYLVDVVGVDGRPAVSLLNNGKSLYREFGMTAKYQFGHAKNQVVASYTRSHAIGDLNYFNDYFGNLQNPLIRPNQRSLQNYDVPNRVLIWSDLNLPKNIIISPVLDWRDGFPYSLVDQYSDFVGTRNRAGRFPRFVSMDVQATKGFALPFKDGKYKARAGVRIFNITDHNNPRDIYNNIGGAPVTFRDECSSVGQFCNSVGRIIRGKLSFEF